MKFKKLEFTPVIHKSIEDGDHTIYVTHSNVIGKQYTYDPISTLLRCGDTVIHAFCLSIEDALSIVQDEHEGLLKYHLAQYTDYEDENV